MSNQPLNLAVRFILELSALAAMAYWGFREHAGAWGVIWGIGLPLLAAVLWGVFRVPNDPGPAPVATPGPVRLLLEIAYFTVAVVLLYVADRSGLALAFAAAALAHYVVSYDRVARLLRNAPM